MCEEYICPHTVVSVSREPTPTDYERARERLLKVLERKLDVPPLDNLEIFRV